MDPHSLPPELSDADLAALTTYVFGEGDSVLSDTRAAELLEGDVGQAVVAEFTALRALGGVRRTPDHRAAWEIVRRRMNDAEPENRRLSRSRGLGAGWGRQTLRRGLFSHGASIVRPFWAGALAAAIIVVALTTTFRKAIEASDSQSLTRDYVVPRGQQATVTLPDGSRAVLGPETTLRFTTTAQDRARILDLKGQAFFTVVPDNTRPFLVHASHVTARVLGTEFDVRKYSSDSSVRIVVASGKVAVRSRTGSSDSMVTAHTLVQVTDSGQIMVTHGIVIDDELAWSQHRLVFRDTPMAIVATELERRYDIDIRFADPSLRNNRFFTASLDAETTTEVLDYLAITLNARYTRVGRVVTFTPARRVLQRAPALSHPFSEKQYGR